MHHFFDLPIVPPKKRPTHIALVVNDIEAVIESYSKVFGIEPVFVKDFTDLSGVKTYYKGELLQEEFCKVAVFDFEMIKLKFIEPGEGQSIWSDFIEINGEGTHHIAFKVDDFNESLNECKSRGWEVIQSSYREDGSGIYAYLDSIHDLGCMIEIYVQ